MRCARAVASEEENPPTPRARISPSATNPRQDRLRQLGHAHAQFQITIETAPEKWEKSISPALRDGIQIWHQLLQAQFPLDLGWERGRGMMVDATPQSLFSQLLSLRRPASAEIEMLARRHFGARPGNFLFRHRREPFFRSRSNLSLPWLALQLAGSKELGTVSRLVSAPPRQASTLGSTCLSTCSP